MLGLLPVGLLCFLLLLLLQPLTNIIHLLRAPASMTWPRPAKLLVDLCFVWSSRCWETALHPAFSPAPASSHFCVFPTFLLDVTQRSITASFPEQEPNLSVYLHKGANPIVLLCFHAFQVKDHKVTFHNKWMQKTIKVPLNYQNMSRRGTIHSISCY